MATTNQARRNRQRRRELERKMRRAGEDVSARSQPAKPAPSQSRQLRAADTHRTLRDRISAIAKLRGEWAGVPMPLDGERLVIEPRYPFAKALMETTRTEEPGELERQGARERSSFYSTHRRCEIVVIEKPDGRITYGIIPAFHSVDKQLRTMGAADAWGLEQEEKAMELLAGLVTPRQYRQYVLTGTFLETSKRSKLTYMFRRLRPTVAIDASGAECKVRCSLCMHPIAYYADSWGGAMCPTDDVIAHLSLMRGDEAMFWRRSTQHPAYRPEAGL
jgi:hypothetical protein